MCIYKSMCIDVLRLHNAICMFERIYMHIDILQYVQFFIQMRIYYEPIMCTSRQVFR